MEVLSAQLPDCACSIMNASPPLSDVVRCSTCKDAAGAPVPPWPHCVTQDRDSTAKEQPSSSCKLQKTDDVDIAEQQKKEHKRTDTNFTTQGFQNLVTCQMHKIILQQKTRELAKERQLKVDSHSQQHVDPASTAAKIPWSSPFLPDDADCCSEEIIERSWPDGSMERSCIGS